MSDHLTYEDAYRLARLESIKCNEDRYIGWDEKLKSFIVKAKREHDYEVRCCRSGL